MKLNTSINFEKVFEIKDPFLLLSDKKFKLTEDSMYCEPLNNMDYVEDVLKMLHRNNKPYVIVRGEGELKDRMFKGWCIFMRKEDM